MWNLHDAHTDGVFVIHWSEIPTGFFLEGLFFSWGGEPHLLALRRLLDREGQVSATGIIRGPIGEIFLFMTAENPWKLAMTSWTALLAWARSLRMSPWQLFEYARHFPDIFYGHKQLYSVFHLGFHALQLIELYFCIWLISSPARVTRPFEKKKTYGKIQLQDLWQR